MEIPVAFLFAGDIPRSVAQKMIDSVRDCMPSSPIIHQTDEDTPAFEGTETVRLKWENRKDPAEFFWLHMKNLRGDFIKLDYDCVMQQSLRGVFNHDFEAGLTIRDDRDVSISRAFLVRHPHNAGVMFSKGSHSFWQEVYDVYCALPDRDGWMDACDALETAVKRTKVRVKNFPAFEYNYTPISPYERLEGKYVVHYKGVRKHWYGAHDAEKAGAHVKKMVDDWALKQRVTKQVQEDA